MQTVCETVDKIPNIILLVKAHLQLLLVLKIIQMDFYKRQELHLHEII